MTTLKTLLSVCICVTIFLSVNGQVTSRKGSSGLKDTVVNVGNFATIDCSELDSHQVYSFSDTNLVTISFLKTDFISELNKKIASLSIEWDIELKAQIDTYPDADLNKLDTSDIYRSRIKFIIRSLIEESKCCVQREVVDGEIKRLTKFKSLENNHVSSRYFTEDGTLVIETYDGAF